MMEVSARDQGKSLLVDNNLLSIYFSRYNNKHQDFKFFPPFIFHVLFFQRQGHEDKSYLGGQNNKAIGTSLGG